MPSHISAQTRRRFIVQLQTELGERLVTVNVGDLDAESLEVALKRGMNEAKRMLDAGLIIAAVLVLKNEIRTVGDVPAALMKTAN